MRALAKGARGTVPRSRRRPEIIPNIAPMPLESASADLQSPRTSTPASVIKLQGLAKCQASTWPQLVAFAGGWLAERFGGNWD